MSAIGDRLRELGWHHYEAAVYESLLEHGVTIATDLAVKARVPLGRVYDILAMLEKRGAVRILGHGRRSYDAQHPRLVMQTQVTELQQAIDEAIAPAERLFELRAARVDSESSAAWTATGAHGVLHEVEAALEGAHESFWLVDRSLAWMRPRHHTRLRDLVERGVRARVLASDLDTEALERAAGAGAEVHAHPNPEWSFCIADEELTLLKLTQPETVSVVRDRKLAAVLLDTYARLRSDARKVEVTSIAPP